VTSIRIDNHGFGSILLHQVKTGLGLNHIAYLTSVVDTCAGCGVGMTARPVVNARARLIPVSTVT
jgi:hypothetical protein